MSQAYILFIYEEILGVFNSRDALLKGFKEKLQEDIYSNINCSYKYPREKDYHEIRIKGIETILLRSDEELVNTLLKYSIMNYDATEFEMNQLIKK